MKIICTYLCILTVISSPAFVKSELATKIQGERKCSSNFSPYQITTRNQVKNTCAYISTKGLSWDDAKLHCNLLLAQLTQQVHFKSSLRTELLKKGIHNLWMGIRRRHNFFVTEYPSKLFRETDAFSRDYWGYHWSDGEPGRNDCVALNVTSGSLQTRRCDDFLPFVCDDAGKDISTLYGGLECPESWNLSIPLSSSRRTCIFLQKSRTYEQIAEICNVKNGQRLANIMEYNILFTNRILTPLDGESFWLKKRNFEICYVTTYINGNMSQALPEPCTLKHSFVCVKQYKVEGIRMHLSPNSIESMQSTSKDAVDLLTCDVDTQVYDVKDDLWYQWYKDDLPIPANSNVVRLSSIGDALKRDPYTSSIVSRQGYYHCKVQLPGTNETYSSSKLKFFYSDIATYFVEIHGIKDASDFDYSHQQFLDLYMNEFEEASVYNIFNHIRSHYPDVDWDFASKSILNGEVIMKIAIYIYKSDLDNFNERMACEDLKDAFEELESVPVFIEDMSVHINCEDFPITNADVQVMRSLRNIEDKLNRIENRQDDILKKLDDLEVSINTKSELNSLDVENILDVVDSLKNWNYYLNDKTSDDENLEGGHFVIREDFRERNELEGDSDSEMEKKSFVKLKEKIASKDVSPRSKTGHTEREWSENYVKYPEKESPLRKESTSKVTTRWRDL